MGGGNFVVVLATSHPLMGCMSIQLRAEPILSTSIGTFAILNCELACARLASLGLEFKKPQIVGGGQVKDGGQAMPTIHCGKLFCIQIKMRRK